ncbi:MAG: Na/Pi cotransporter family protein [Eubacteriaceae bacterium]|nr:Na/Pi cotransporter family protein [Eubacteriaceae bacterium]
MNDVFQTITTLLGGLALFIFGMNMMSDGLQKAAGDKMRSFLALLTKNPVLGVLAGAACTAVLQSSSATTVMVIGFVSAGLMKLPQAISVILGANIGTTITAQLIAFKIGDYAWIVVFIGFLMFFFLKKHEKVSQIGQILFAFGILFVGINTMSDVMKPLADSPVFTNLMMQVQDLPGLGVLLGAVMTMVVQSSSATIAVLQNLASTAGPDGVHSILGLQGSLPILFGDNIGTTITALLASIGASVNAKRTAVAHVIFNVSGTLLFIWFIPYIAKFVAYISPKGAEIEVISRQIANSHMLFNVCNMLIWLPLIWLLVKIVTKLIPGEEKEVLPEAPIYLDDHVLDRPVFAIHLATKELSRLSGYTSEMIVKSKTAFLSGDMQAVREVTAIEDNINKLQDKIVSYLAGILTAEGTTAAQSERVSGLMHVAADIEHIGDYCQNIVELAEEKTKNKYEFSDKACAEIYECFDQITRMLRDTREALDKGDYRIAKIVLDEEKEINNTEKRLRKQHMQRLNDNTCSPAFTVIYTDVIHNIEKVGDCCNNIAEAVLDDVHFKDEFGELAEA